MLRHPATATRVASTASPARMTGMSVPKSSCTSPVRDDDEFDAFVEDGWGAGFTGCELDQVGAKPDVRVVEKWSLSSRDPARSLRAST